MIDRRALLVAALWLTVPSPALAADFAIDWGEGLPDPQVLARTQRQIAMVRAAPVRADVAAFWARETIYLQPRAGMPSRTGARLLLTRDPYPDDNPVLLHEMIHRWHRERLAQTPRAAALREAFAAERAAPQWPANSYMYQNIMEYLAMCGSVAIHGRAARAPFTRDAVRTQLPATWRFIVAEFGLAQRPSGG